MAKPKKINVKRRSHWKYLNEKQLEKLIVKKKRDSFKAQESMKLNPTITKAADISEIDNDLDLIHELLKKKRMDKTETDNDS
jgi:hypothetical protein